MPFSVKSFARLLRSSAISSQALALSAVNAASSSSHGCFSEVYEEVALRAANAADQRFAEGTSLGLLDGIPFAIKDNFCTEFGNTTARCTF
jgi:aspartyl-tRNA(Asn)/glutamyl-tRNA(Gln) amidotransferase subunit A